MGHRGHRIGDGRPSGYGPVAQRVGQGGRASKPLLRRFGETAQDRAFQLRREVRIQGARRRRSLLDVGQGDGQIRFGFERHTAGGHLVQHRAQAVHVRLRHGFAAPHNFGRDVVDRAHDCAGTRQAAGSQCFGDAEVGQPRSTVLTQEHVLGFDVAVDQALAVRVLECRGQSRADRTDLTVRERRGATDAVLQVATLDQLHDDERRARFRVLADVVDRHDVRMAQARRGTRLASKALEGLGIACVLRVQQLDGYAPIQQRILRLPDGRHPAPRDLADQTVAPAEHALAASRAHKRLTSSSASATRSPCRRRISRSA